MTGSPLASPSATLAVLKRHGLHTRKSLGQHFLVDDNIVQRILSLAALSGRERVLEVGPGIGTLTIALCASSGHVVAVERDQGLLPLLAETTASCDNLDVINDDAVSVPVAALQEDDEPVEMLVANLPYAVAATVVLRFFQQIPMLRSAIVMVQAEVADRMAANPGSKAYGAYSVKLQLLARSAGRFAVPRSCFLPPPRVDSAVIRLDRTDAGLDPETQTATTSVVEAAFAQRRKTIRNSLRSVLGKQCDVDALLDSAGVDGIRRAETLTVDEFINLGEKYRALCL